MSPKRAKPVPPPPRKMGKSPPPLPKTRTQAPGASQPGHPINSHRPPQSKRRPYQPHLRRPKSLPPTSPKTSPKRCPLENHPLPSIPEAPSRNQRIYLGPLTPWTKGVDVGYQSSGAQFREIILLSPLQSQKSRCVENLQGVEESGEKEV